MENLTNLETRPSGGGSFHQIYTHIRKINEVKVRQLDDLEPIADLTHKGWLVLWMYPEQDQDGNRYYLLVLGLRDD